MACIALGDKTEARRLLRIAAAYRPTDETVQNALASVALPIG
jgi:Flp pilus assembly protein TadD